MLSHNLVNIGIHTLDIHTLDMQFTSAMLAMHANRQNTLAHINLWSSKGSHLCIPKRVILNRERFAIKILQSPVHLFWRGQNQKIVQK